MKKEKPYRDRRLKAKRRRQKRDAYLKIGSGIYAVGGTVSEDMRRHPWKLPLLATPAFGFNFILSATGACLINASGITQKAKPYKDRLIHVLSHNAQHISKASQAKTSNDNHDVSKEIHDIQIKGQTVYDLTYDQMSHALSPLNKNIIRLTHIFKAAVDVLIDDSARHPWKLVCYADHIIGTWLPVTIGTGIYYAAANSNVAKQARAKITHATEAPIDYRLYRESMQIDANGHLKLRPLALAKSTAQYATHQVFNSLNTQVSRLPPHNLLRRAGEKTVLRNRQSRALTVVS